jgi:hypothetical protein
VTGCREPFLDLAHHRAREPRLTQLQEVFEDDAADCKLLRSLAAERRRFGYRRLREVAKRKIRRMRSSIGCTARRSWRCVAVAAESGRSARWCSCRAA